jgi:hypothetical protein
VDVEAAVAETDLRLTARQPHIDGQSAQLENPEGPADQIQRIASADHLAHSFRCEPKDLQIELGQLTAQEVIAHTPAHEVCCAAGVAQQLAQLVQHPLQLWVSEVEVRRLRLWHGVSPGGALRPTYLGTG